MIVDFSLYGAKRAHGPVGSAAAAGVALAETFYKTVPPTGMRYLFRSTVPGGSTIQVLVTTRDYSVKRASALISAPSFASMMADSVAALVRYVLLFCLLITGMVWGSVLGGCWMLEVFARFYSFVSVVNNVYDLESLVGRVLETFGRIC